MHQGPTASKAAGGTGKADLGVRARDKKVGVRAGVAGDPSTPPEILRAMTTDPSRPGPMRRTSWRPSLPTPIPRYAPVRRGTSASRWINSACSRTTGPPSYAKPRCSRNGSLSTNCGASPVIDRSTCDVAWPWIPPRRKPSYGYSPKIRIPMWRPMPGRTCRRERRQPASPRAL
ncbi:hypothetical protein [Nonomuraea sp. NPDC049725]|uniref:hypothetical protein n=1 Tax=Nonomuraea sp. NPDC049725 TaxID=3154508 RepID=UPI0034395F53